MNQDFLSPVKETALAHLVLHSPYCLGNRMRIHTQQDGFPELDNVKLAIFGVEEDRNSENNLGCGDNLHFIRRKLYELFPGNWNAEIADLGTIRKGNTIEDIASYQSSETHDAAAGLQFVPATTFFEHNSGAGALPTQGPNDARSSLSKVEGWLSPGSRRSSLLERTVMFGGDLDALNTSEDRDNGWKALRVSRH